MCKARTRWQQAISRACWPVQTRVRLESVKILLLREWRKPLLTGAHAQQSHSSTCRTTNTLPLCPARTLSADPQSLYCCSPGLSHAGMSSAPSDHACACLEMPVKLRTSCSGSLPGAGHTFLIPVSVTALKKMQNMLNRFKKKYKKTTATALNQCWLANYSTGSFLFPLLCGHKRPCFASFFCLAKVAKQPI